LKVGGYGKIEHPEDGIIIGRVLRIKAGVVNLMPLQNKFCDINWAERETSVPTKEEIVLYCLEKL